MSLLLYLIRGNAAAKPADAGDSGFEKAILTTMLGADFAGSYAYAPDRLIIKLRSQATPGSKITGIASLDTVMAAQGGRAMRPLFQGEVKLKTSELSRIYVVELQPRSEVLAAVKAFASDPNVEWAEPDYLARAASLSNDPLLSGQWGMEKISAAAAWDVVTGTPSVVIAILDTGIDVDHPDLVNRLWTNPGETPGNGIDDDNNGYIDDVNGWNFIARNNEVDDDDGHGTEVAGAAAAEGNNATGITGVCWNCRIMSVKVMQAGGVANYSDVALGVYYAAVKGVEVINLSLGGYARSKTLQAAIETASQTSVIVAAAGDDSTNNLFYPAAYSQALAVAGTDASDARAANSNYGDWVDVAAPAFNITTTLNGGEYGDASGTSLAAPLVSGLAGLVWGQHPEWIPSLVRSQLIQTTDPIVAAGMGSGRINAFQAVTVTPHPSIFIISTAINGDSLGYPNPGEASQLAVTLSNSWLDATGVSGSLATTDAYVSIITGTATYGEIASGASDSGQPNFGFNVATGAGYNHPIAFTLNLAANAGAYTISLPITITTRSANQNVGGTLPGSTTWTNDKTYIVNNNIGVPSGMTLTIQAGTVVKFNGNYSLNIAGTLIADGTSTQYIRLMSNTGSTWGRINFIDSSTDAVADGSGNYLGGNILRYVQIENASQGIGCTNATPYLSHINLTVGGVNCSLGSTTIWLMDNNLAGEVSISGSGQAWRNIVSGGGLTLSGQATMRNNTIKNDISAGSNSLVHDNVVGGSINVGGSSIVQINTVSGGHISAGNAAMIQDNQISGGGITIGGSAFALRNTVKGGGIGAGSGSLVQGNDVESSTGWGISTSGVVSITHNRVVGNANGVNASGGLVQGNLIANSSGVGLQVSGGIIVSNTLTENHGNTLVISSGTPAIHGNNCEFNKGSFDLVNNSISPINVSGNWWGTTENSVIDERVWDYLDDMNLGLVTYDTILTEPVQTAPAYVRSVIIDPPSPVGIETTRFEVLFSRPMDKNIMPTLYFQRTLTGNLDWFKVENSGIGSNTACGDNLVDSKGDIWIGGGRSWRPNPSGDVNAGCGGGLSILRHDGSWSLFPNMTNGLAEDNLGNVLITDFEESAIAVDKLTGDIWRGKGVYSLGVAVNHSDGSVELFNHLNSGLISDRVWSLAIDNSNSDVWIGTWDGLSVRHSNGQWANYLPGEHIVSVAVDRKGNIWAGTYHAGVYRRDASKDSWNRYSYTSSGLKYDCIWDIHVDLRDNIWFSHGSASGATGCGGGVSVLHTNGTWNSYNPGEVWSITSDVHNNIWFNTERNGLAVLWGGIDYRINGDTNWVSSTVWQGNYEINSLVPRDEYKIVVQDAFGENDIQIAPNNTYTFTVDYIGNPETDTPPKPIVRACASTGATTLTAQWNVTSHSVGLYRYALGTAPGLTDVTNWVTTTLSTVTRTNLNLLAGQTYYFSVKARNTGGIWSAVGNSNGVVAGAGGCPQVDFNATPTNTNAGLAVNFASQITGTVTSYLWSFGDGLTSTLTGPLHVYIPPGVYTVTLDVLGPGGWAEKTRASYITVTPDITPPSGSLNINSGAISTANTAVTLQANASDPSGMKDMRFSNDGSSYSIWEPYNATKSWMLTSGDGEKTVYVQARDNPGNTATFTDTIYLDTAPPNASITDLPAFEGTASFSVTWSGSDAYSGIASYDVQYRVGSGGIWNDWRLATELTSVSFTGGTHGQTYYFRARARDTLGNQGSYATGDGDLHTTVDFLPPTGSMQVNSGTAYANNTNVTLNFSVSDLSGLNAFQASNDGVDFGAWTEYAASSPWIIASGDGLKTVYVRLRDHVGHISDPISDTITLDTLAPDGSISINSGAIYASSLGVTLTLSASDSNSDIYQMQFSNDGTTWSAWQEYGTAKTWTLSSGDGVKTIYVYYTDTAGNIALFNDTIILDTTPPSAAVLMLPPYQTTSDFTVSWAGIDAWSGLTNYDVQVRDGDSAWTDWMLATTNTSASFAGLDGHNYSFRCRARDNLGNLGLYASGDGDVSTTIDTTRPEGSIQINAGAIDTTSRDVILGLAAIGASQMAFSEDGVNYGYWEPFSVLRSYQLSSGNGLKTVYVRFRDLADNVTDASDTITLNTSLPGEEGVTINDDSALTEEVTVTLTLKAPAGTRQMMISNSSRFVTAEWETYSATRQWVLAYHPGVDVYQVYAKFRAMDGTISPRYDDLITLHLLELPPPVDSAPPSGSMVINAGAEATSIRNATLDVLAADNPGGVGVKWMYFREWKYDPVTVQWLIVQNSGWLSYQDQTSWELSAGTGAKYVGAWFADGANNVSNPVVLDDINLILPGDTLGANQVTQYRQTFEPGQTVTVTLDMSSGDADLYIWRPGSIGAPALWSNLPGTADEQLVFTAVEGEYLIEVHGYSSAVYTLDISTSLVGGGVSSQKQPIGRWASLISRKPSVSSTTKPLPTKPLVTTRPTEGLPGVDVKVYLYLPTIRK